MTKRDRRGMIGFSASHAARRPARAASGGPARENGPRTAAERWATHVLRACEADGDLKTLGDWAAFAGLSYSSLCESCRILSIRPQDARDLARVLRAAIVAARDRCHLEALLDVSDSRTLRRLLVRAGLDVTPRTPRVDALLDAQQFVSAENDGLKALRRLLAARTGS